MVSSFHLLLPLLLPPDLLVPASITHTAVPQPDYGWSLGHNLLRQLTLQAAG
jgi:hypothetical protein